MADKYAQLKNSDMIAHTRSGQRRLEREQQRAATQQPQQELSKEEIKARIRENIEKGKKVTQKPQKIVTIKFRLNIQEHDLSVKNKKVHEELHKGHQVKLVLQLIGREKSRPEIGAQWLNQQAEVHKDYSTPNKPATRDNLSITLFPTVKK